MSLKWKPKAATYSSVAPKLSGSRHAHACCQCHQRYEDACSTPSGDEVCNSCVYGHAWPAWRTSRLPQGCCSASQLATPEERRTHRLGGTATWWICPTCKRTHPYNPKEKVA